MAVRRVGLPVLLLGLVLVACGDDDGGVNGSLATVVLRGRP